MDRIKRLAARLERVEPFRTGLAVNSRYGADGGGQLAASLAYYAFLSLFPLILLALAVVGFILANDPEAQADWAARLSESIPGFGPLIAENIDALIDKRSGAGAIGAIGLLWSGTGLTNAGAFTMSRVFRAKEVEGILRKRLWSIAVTIGLGLAAAAGVVFSGVVGNRRATGGLGIGLSLIAFAVSFVLDVGLFAVSYRVLSAGRGPPFRRLWPGALLAGGGWSILKIGGAWYATHTVARASEVYGTFGSVVGVLAVLYIAAQLFLYGAELNAVRCGIDEEPGTA
ncbi:MAG TPA: YihY/virulence factor BrkB family protein [Actinomycetota bacterium]|jgi:YihY family inner membrane protein|nr:YihY/virulence factor BrkB family protein [Actinomycetota bacterium]